MKCECLVRSIEAENAWAAAKKGIDTIRSSFSAPITIVNMKVTTPTEEGRPTIHFFNVHATLMVSAREDGAQ